MEDGTFSFSLLATASAAAAAAAAAVVLVLVLVVAILPSCSSSCVVSSLPFRVQVPQLVSQILVCEKKKCLIGRGAKNHFFLAKSFTKCFFPPPFPLYLYEMLYGGRLRDLLYGLHHPLHVTLRVTLCSGDLDLFSDEVSRVLLRGRPCHLGFCKRERKA